MKPTFLIVFTLFTATLGVAYGSYEKPPMIKASAWSKYSSQYTVPKYPTQTAPSSNSSGMVQNIVSNGILSHAKFTVTTPTVPKTIAIELDEMQKTNDVHALTLNMKATGDDLRLNILPIHLKSTTSDGIGHIHAMVKSAELYADGIKIAELIPTAIIQNKMEAILPFGFNGSLKYVIEKNKTVEFKVTLNLGPVNDSLTPELDFDESDTIQASYPNIYRNKTSIITSIGNQVYLGNRSGAAFGSILTFFQAE